MSLSFTMLVCLYEYVSAYKNSSRCTNFHGTFYWGGVLMY